MSIIMDMESLWILVKFTNNLANERSIIEEEGNHR